MNAPRREGYLHQNGTAGLSIGSIRDVIPYVWFLSLLFDFSILLAILPPKIKDITTAISPIPSIPTLSQFSVLLVSWAHLIVNTFIVSFSFSTNSTAFLASWLQKGYLHFGVGGPLIF